MYFKHLTPEEVIANPELRCPTLWHHSWWINNVQNRRDGYALVTNTDYVWVFDTYEEVLAECARWQNEVTTYFVYRCESNWYWTLMSVFTKYV